MIDYVYGYDELVAGFVAQLIPSCRTRGFGNCKAIGVINNGVLTAGFVYHNYDPDAQVIQVSGAALPGARWCNRETLWRVFQYPFLQLDCQMIIQLVDADDERTLGQLARIGHAFKTIPRLFGRDKDGVLATLTSEDWDASKFNQRLRDLPQLSEAA